MDVWTIVLRRHEVRRQSPPVKPINLQGTHLKPSKELLKLRQEVGGMGAGGISEAASAPMCANARCGVPSLSTTP